MEKQSKAGFVEKLAADPKKLPRTVVVFGWLARAVRNDARRLYLSADLRYFVELPKKSVLHQQDLPTSVSPLGGAYFWIDEDVAVQLIIETTYWSFDNSTQ